MVSIALNVAVEDEPVADAAATGSKPMNSAATVAIATALLLAPAPHQWELAARHRDSFTICGPFFWCLSIDSGQRPLVRTG
jgi:hypothetical protein